MLLEKKLKFFTIIDNMSNSTKIQGGEDLQKIQSQMEDYKKENALLKTRIKEMEKSSSPKEELAKLEKKLKKQAKLHEADLYVLSDLQKVIKWSL